VAFEGNDIVVAWIGGSLVGCENLARIYARRLTFNPAGPPIMHEQFLVTEDPAWNELSGQRANPSVALVKANGPDDGRFIVVWNANQTTGGWWGIRARFFDADGRPRGREFQVHAQNYESWNNLFLVPSVAESATHTVAYAPSGDAIVAWTVTGDLNTDGYLEPTTVRYSYIPASYSATLYARGDCNTDGFVDGRDIQPFVSAWIGGLPAGACPYGVSPPAPRICPFDADGDGDFSTNDSQDLQAFVCLLLHGPDACASCSGAGMDSTSPGGEGESSAASVESAAAAPEGQSAATSPPPLREAVRAFVQWLDANLHASHPELTDSEHYKLIKRKLRELGLLPE
jgi:hypothetical protein